MNQIFYREESARRTITSDKDSGHAHAPMLVRSFVRCEVCSRLPRGAQQEIPSQLYLQRFSHRLCTALCDGGLLVRDFSTETLDAHSTCE
jgi:hypothetical protein